MKPALLNLSTNTVQAFSSRRDTLPGVNNRWHYHPEIELIYFRSGNGTQFIGDNISQFSSGDIVLVGSNLPHFWKFDDEYFAKGRGDCVDVCVVHFNECFWGETFYGLTENAGLREIIKKSTRGLQINGVSKISISLLMERIMEETGIRKLITLLDILATIAECTELKLLASVGFKNNFSASEKDRINAIYNYSIANFKNKITLEQAAEVAHMTPRSFCKYFKSRNRKTYFEFLTELRVGNACKLLIEDQLRVSEVCEASVFIIRLAFINYLKGLPAKAHLLTKGLS